MPRLTDRKMLHAALACRPSPPPQMNGPFIWGWPYRWDIHLAVASGLEVGGPVRPSLLPQRTHDHLAASTQAAPHPRVADFHASAPSRYELTTS